MKRLNKKNLIIILLLLISFTTLGYSSFQIYKWKMDNKKNENMISTILKNYPVKVITTNKDESEENTSDYIKVDFERLKEENNDLVGWLRTGAIDYPFVQANNNEYYLKHSFDKSKNIAGWIFLDCRNSKDLTDKNNIIYGHNMKNKTMFGSLRDYLEEDWFKDKNNHIININTENQSSNWQIFSIYKIEDNTDYLEVDFKDDEFKTFIDKISKRSMYKFDIEVNESDKILTLSTCSGFGTGNNRLVIHAKLIESFSTE